MILPVTIPLTLMHVTHLLGSFPSLRRDGVDLLAQDHHLFSEPWVAMGLAILHHREQHL